MANRNAPFGARVIGTVGGSSYTGVLNPYTVLATDTSPLFVGDAVKLTGETAKGADGVTRSVVTKITGGSDVIVGFVMGLFINPDNLTLNYRPASTLSTAYINIDPNVKFFMQANGEVAAADIGKNADIDLTTAGDITFGLSGMQVDTATFDTAEKQLNVKDIVPAIDNELGDYARLICTVVKHFYKQNLGV
jgi:hypothetical protein